MKPKLCQNLKKISFIKIINEKTEHVIEPINLIMYEYSINKNKYVYYTIKDISVNLEIQNIYLELLINFEEQLSTSIDNLKDNDTHDVNRYLNENISKILTSCIREIELQKKLQSREEINKIRKKI